MRTRMLAHAPAPPREALVIVLGVTSAGVSKKGSGGGKGAQSTSMRSVCRPSAYAMLSKMTCRHTPMASSAASSSSTYAQQAM